MKFKKGNIPWNKRDKIEKVCNVCGKKYYVVPSKKDTAKFCSNKCKIENQKGKPSWNKGTKGICKGSFTSFKKGHQTSKEHQEKLRILATGEKSHIWKGEQCSYCTKHNWVTRWKGRPGKCEDCGKIGQKVNGKWNINWANIDHKYRRILDDYLPKCVPCHRKYDKKFN